ncbi:unnamed protein product [Allacma fusca]|uniref:Uncharacterized protein n=1 Tax=Allacma fusca TaxID=39272 RepID=A0A8J2JVW7_9HEXA|nr:unnamed protein product [Allacma fusca]
MLTTTLECNGQSLQTPVYVVEGLGRPLLSLENCIAINLIRRVNQAEISPQVTTVDPENEFPGIFDGLGELDGEYEIKLVDNAMLFLVQDAFQFH